MIEYYTLMHKGSEKLYRDNIFLNFGSTITVLMLYVSKNVDVVLDSNLSMKLSSAISSCSNVYFDELSRSIDELILERCDYLLLQMNDTKVEVRRNGNVYAEIVKNGELKRLPNGLFSLDDDDHIVCGTKAFFQHLTQPAVISDALTSISSEEWMDSLAFRIAEQSNFSESNITAVTFIVRKD